MKINLAKIHSVAIGNMAQLRQPQQQQIDSSGFDRILSNNEQ